jgi:thiol:disulfide interchange protein
MRRALKVIVIFFALGAVAWAARDHFATSFVLEAPRASSIAWRPNFNVALHEAQRSHLPLFVVFKASWCPDCRQLQTTTFSDPTVMAAINTTVPVQVDVDKEPEVTKKYSVDAIPAVLFIDPRSGGIVRGQRETVLPPQEFLAWFNGKSE